MPGPLRRVTPDLAAFVALLAVSIFATWPLASHLGTHVASDLGDPLENAWIFGWGGHAILEQPRALFHANMFFPSRYSLAFAENMLGLSIPVAPVFWVTGNAVLTVNIATLLIFAMSGWAVYRLILELAGHRAAAMLAALAFTVLPYRVGSVAHVHVVATHLLPLALLMIVRLARSSDHRLRNGLLLAALVGAQLWGSLTAGMLTLAACGVAVVWVVVSRGRDGLRPAILAGVAVAGGLLLAVPVVLTYSRARDQNPEYTHPEVEVIENSATWGAYAFPPLGGDIADDVYDDLAEAVRPEHTPQEKTLFPGFVLSITAVVAIVSSIILAIRRRGPLAALGLVWAIAATGLILSFGPRWGARESGTPLPFALLSSFVSGGLTRVPARFGALALFGIVGAVGIVVGQITDRRWRIGACGAIAALLLIEAWPTAVITPRVPVITDAHRDLAGTDRRVIALPMLEFSPGGALLIPSLPREATHLWFSTANFRPIVNGYGAFLPKPYGDTVRLMQDFPTDAAIDHLLTLGVDTVIVETAMVPGTRWQDVSDRLAAWPGAELVEEAGGTQVWDITAAT